MVESDASAGMTPAAITTAPASMTGAAPIAIRDAPAGRPRDHRGQRGRADEQPERGGVVE